MHSAAPLVSSAGLSPGTSVTAWAVDGFARLDYGPVSLVATGYTGRGVGTTGLFFDGVAADGSARKSDGGYMLGVLQHSHSGWQLGRQRPGYC